MPTYGAALMKTEMVVRESRDRWGFDPDYDRVEYLDDEGRSLGLCVIERHREVAAETETNALTLTYLYGGVIMVSLANC